jgi:hypothetical protein
MFQRCNVRKMVLFIHLDLIFLVSRSARTNHQACVGKLSVPINIVVLTSVGYGSRSESENTLELIRIREIYTDPNRSVFGSATLVHTNFNLLVLGLYMKLRVMYK